MTDHVDSIVAGAGVVGLAIARQLALAGREVIVLEAADAIGTGTSSRNSEVIHAGIYYAKDSLKARFCVAGKAQLYAYCESHGVPYRRLGKLIVATAADEVERLDGIRAQAAANGVTDLRPVDAAELRELEPNVEAAGALLSPSTGIVDSHSLMLALQGDAETHGTMVAFHAPVERGHVGNGVITLDVGGEAPMTLSCDHFFNAAGLGAQDLAGRLQGLPAATIPPLYYAKGNYFVLAGANPFNHLIYPVPVPGGLGTHSTTDLGGQVKFGPDVEWVDQPEYEVDPARGEKFYAAIRRYWPGLPDGALQPGYVGMRPKLSAPGSEKHTEDFVIQGPDEHGVQGLVNLYGIESPGLTSSLAIAEHVASAIKES